MAHIEIKTGKPAVTPSDQTVPVCKDCLWTHTYLRKI